MRGDVESATQKLVRFCLIRGYRSLLRALVRWANFVALSLMLSPSVATSQEDLDGSVSKLFEQINTKPVELRHFCKTFPKVAISTAICLVQFTQSHILS